MKKHILLRTLALAMAVVLVFVMAGCAPVADATAAGVTVGGATPGEIVSNFITAAVQIALLAVMYLFTKVILPFVKNTVVPALEQRSVFRTIRILVAAAEKQGETGAIPKDKKKLFVIGWLESLGITVTEKEKQMIEAAVEELDKMGSALLEAVIGDPLDSETALPDTGAEEAETE